MPRRRLQRGWTVRPSRQRHDCLHCAVLRSRSGAQAECWRHHPGLRAGQGPGLLLKQYFHPSGLRPDACPTVCSVLRPARRCPCQLACPLRRPRLPLLQAYAASFIDGWVKGRGADPGWASADPTETAPFLDLARLYCACADLEELQAALYPQRSLPARLPGSAVKGAAYPCLPSLLAGAAAIGSCSSVHRSPSPCSSRWAGALRWPR